MLRGLLGSGLMLERAHFVRFSKVFHVGADPTGKKPRTRKNIPHIMLEGRELSVSQHPEAWRHIAGLAGKVFVGKRRTPGKFLDALRSRETVRRWGVESGFLQPRIVWRVTRFDEELDDTTFMDFATEAEARRELADFADDDTLAPERVASFGFGPEGRKYAKLVTTKRVDDDLALSWAPIGYARAMQLAGVWWFERLDELNYSAPRGCILWEDVVNWEWEEEA